MDYLQLMKIRQAVQNTFSNLTKHLLYNTTSKHFDLSVNIVETTALTESLGDGDPKSATAAVILANPLRVASCIELHFSVNLLPGIQITITISDILLIC
jgi:hypothetical protein